MREWLRRRAQRRLWREVHRAERDYTTAKAQGRDVGAASSRWVAAWQAIDRSTR